LIGCAANFEYLAIPLSTREVTLEAFYPADQDTAQVLGSD
jgi:hypothetical protein